MEKTVWRNIMAIYEDRRIFRRILKRDLALDRTFGRRGSRRIWLYLVGERMDVSNLVGESTP